MYNILILSCDFLVEEGDKGGLGGDELPHLDVPGRHGVPPLGWKLLSCSQCQKLGKKANLFLLAAQELTTNQKPGQQIDPTLPNDYNSQVSTPEQGTS